MPTLRTDVGIRFILGELRRLRPPRCQGRWGCDTCLFEYSLRFRSILPIGPGVSAIDQPSHRSAVVYSLQRNLNRFSGVGCADQIGTRGVPKAPRGAPGSVARSYAPWRPRRLNRDGTVAGSFICADDSQSDRTPGYGSDSPPQGTDQTTSGGLANAQMTVRR